MIFYKFCAVDEDFPFEFIRLMRKFEPYMNVRDIFKIFIRLKGIPKLVILNKCKRMNITVEELYERMYNREEMTFNLLDGSNCFRKSKSFQQIFCQVCQKILLGVVG